MSTPPLGIYLLLAMNETRRPAMKELKGGHKVPGGFYYHKGNWEITVVQGEKGTLPGNEETAWVRIPTLAMLVGAPVMGGLFVVFLPFLGFAMLFNHLGKKAAAGLRSAADEIGEAVGPQYQPGRATFTGKKKAKKEKKAEGEEKTEEGETEKPEETK
jgi:hypothetical protein